MTTQTAVDTRRDRWPWWLARFPWLLIPIPIAFIQLMGTRGAAYMAGHHGAWWNNHDWAAAPVPVPWYGYALALIGPLALLALRGFPRTVVGVTVVTMLVFYSLGLPNGPLFVSVIAALAGWVKMVRGERAAQAKRARAAEAARLAGAERLRIAQELHDILAHHISLINVQSGVALHLVDERPEQTRTALAAIKGASKEALTALRGALDALRNTDDSAPRTPTAGLAQLDELVDSVRAAGIEVNLRVDGQAAPLDPAVDLAALRIIQESLTNVLRHSGATRADVTIDYGDRLTIAVSDNGTGGVPIPGNGLTGMSERAVAVGGDCTAGPNPGGGFTVSARLPR
ncbi:MAG TPA: sensor histidine kinase [Stackebrandtia sp.]|jgi:signal transduction histidine kinase|uniref:sensor histidine kinase n=1 Tax=Stackebrandtia sp. TaxID=2023065 RepID=UPI002D3C49E2|nr:sensor histidine kinase [Stackebrandtia sp.]HZE37587.1 sensor histidine kinase [Stackebrandtia sp.]